VKYKRMHPEKQLGDGWTRWVQPVPKGYLMECCDCGLVHRMNFRTHRGRIQFKAQRASAYTKRARKRLRRASTTAKP
jgi:hypothetical protein